MCIGLNSVVLAIVDFSVVDDKLKPSTCSQSSFTTECSLKVVASGFTAYSRDPWNVIDFIILFSSFVAEIPDMPNISELRTIRVLRPLRTDAVENTFNFGSS
ncbi:Sodium channel protein type 4 subunit alpha B [Phytophthora cinnamomi]|uniref:Sodium channel protein type 4 subunit alpha B n=1 Tax=Phytophthora cinnamomi TaxID=4785 RepID=UPI003559DEDE|nr:Sodium channel protein type 4 subunit alpha B [Phytophthora cinnamomi]